MIRDLLGFRKELDKVNEFWITGSIKELEERKLIFRDIFKAVVSELKERRILIIVGPRRVGKTILLKQCIQKLITEGVQKENILYYSMDDPTLFTFTETIIKDIIDYWLENIAKEGRKYIFFDEIHLCKDWYKWIKAYYDRYSDIKFVLSGSSSLTLQKEANKYLRGRTVELELFPLDFSEFLKLSGKEVSTFSFDDIDAIYKKDYLEIEKIKKEIYPYFKEYILVGGFPEWFEIKDIKKWFDRLISDVPKKAIYEDIVELFGLKNPKILEQILTFIFANQSRVLSYEGINRVAGVDRNTLINYIEFLKSAYLVVEILKFSRNVMEQLRSMKKYLAIDQGLRNAILKDYALKEENIGFIIENTIGMHLFKLAREKNEKIFYMKTDGEVDFIFTNKEIIPIEVKFRTDVSSKELSEIIKIARKVKIKPKRAIIITKDILKKEKINGVLFLFIPAWIFVLCK